jgi:hypothetical protein
MEKVIAGPLCQAIIGQTAEGLLRKRLALPCSHGGLAIPDPRSLALEEFEASQKATEVFSGLMEVGITRGGWKDEIKNKTARRLIREGREKAYAEVAKEVNASLVGRARKAFEETATRGQSGVLTVTPTTFSGTILPALWWRVSLQLRLGLQVQDLPDKCPSCQKKNTLDHALGGGKHGACGAARDRRHDEVVDYVKRLATEAGFIVSAVNEPTVGKIGGPNTKEPDTRVDGIIRGLITPQREAWFDGEVVDTGAWSHTPKEAGKTLEKEEKKKIKKHATRVAVAHSADFVPVVCSVYGSTAYNCQLLVKLCTERMMGITASPIDKSRVLHLQRAKLQAAIWRATALCIVGRRGPKAATASEESAKEKELRADIQMPWLCVAVDARAPPHRN